MLNDGTILDLNQEQLGYFNGSEYGYYSVGTLFEMKQYPHRLPILKGNLKNELSKLMGTGNNLVFQFEIISNSQS
jgi:hypothetical protein